MRSYLSRGPSVGVGTEIFVRRVVAAIADTEHASTDSSVKEDVELAVDEGVERHALELGAVIPLPHHILVDEPGECLAGPVEAENVEALVERLAVVLVLVALAVDNVASSVDLGVYRKQKSASSQ